MALRYSAAATTVASVREATEGLPAYPSRPSVGNGAGPLPQGAAVATTVTLPTPLTPPLLQPVAIIHTTAYLQQTQQLVVPELPGSADERDIEQAIVPQEVADLNSNALVWALKKVDDQLNQVEQQPSPAHQALYEFTNGPVGQATTKGVQVAAKLTMTATIEAAKAAAPMGKWALQQGFKAAVGLIGAAMEQDRKQRRQQQQSEKGK